MERQKNFLEDLTKEKPESFGEEIFVPAKKSPRRIIATLVTVLIIIIIIFMIRRMSDVTVPDMSSWQLEEVQVWAAKNHENTVLKGVYDEEAVQNSILSQDINPKKKIRNSRALSVTYSLGANPEETLEIPDIMSMTLTEIKTWTQDNQATGVTIKYEASEVIPKDQVINYEFIEGSVEEFLRKYRMVIYVSSGAKDVNETIEMPDFYGKTRAEVMQWAKEEQIEVTIDEIFNEYVDYGLVFQQSLKENMKITRKDRITISISRGKPIQVPDFSEMSRGEAAELAGLSGINVFFKLKVSEKEVDTVIDQDIDRGTEIDQNQMLTLQIAKKEGTIIVPDFKGLTLTEANTLAGLYGIKVFLRNSGGVGENGIVASQSVSADKKIDEKQIITLVLKESKKDVLVPNFVGLTKNEAVVLAKNKKIDLIFHEVETTKTSNETVISQNIKSREGIGSGDSILLTIAVNSGIEAEYMWNKSLKEVQVWAAQKGITLNVIESYSSEYAAGAIYDQDCEAKEWIPANKILSVYYSLGLVMIDTFIGKTKSDIIIWKEEVNNKGASIELSFLADTDTTKAKGIITDQSILGELVELDKKILVHVSVTDDGVIIKNFDNTELENFKLWCDTNKVPYIVSDCYSDEYAEGKLYGQNYNGVYLPKGEYLKINHSLGKIYVKDFNNLSKATMIEWQMDVNKKKANIKIVFIEDYSTIEKGRIIYQSVKDKQIDQNSTITVTVSLGS